MLIEWWLDRPVPLIYGLLAALLVTTAAALLLLTSAPRSRGWAGRFGGVVAPFFGAVSVLFGLLTGFLANDAWERNRQAGRAILAERDAAVALYDLSLATVSDMSGLRTALRGYLDAVVGDEWERQRDGFSSPKAKTALTALTREVADPRLAAQSGLVSHAALLDLVGRIRTARGDRLALAEQYSDQAKWWTVILLALLTQVGLALVHLDKPRAQGAALAVFSAAAVAAIGLVAIKERPFDGPLGLAPTALVEAIRGMEGSPVAGSGGNQTSR